MAYLLAKICMIFLVGLFAAAQISDPDSSWSEFQIKTSCPTGFYENGNYCVKCKSPLFFDALSGKCNSCPQGHFYNPTSNRCECTIPCPAPRALNPATSQCECPADSKGNKRVYSDNDKTCNCPDNLPLWNGRYCVVCPAETTYDPAEHQCYHCPDGFVRDGQSHTCVPGL